ncbi:MAG: hypothetical protein ACO3A2_04530 [Bdellovibrionia bacterium]
MTKETSQLREKEHTGSIWTHPYMIYVLLTLVLFLFLLFAGWLAWSEGWLPHPG